MLLKKINRQNIKFHPTQIFALGFAAIILTGALLLTLPISSRGGQWTSFINALFAATSAVCVTGLVVVDTYQYFSGFGQIVILSLIQIGGLGLMTVATLLSIFLRRSISMRERVLQVQSLSFHDITGIVRITKRIILGTLMFEGVGALILSFRFYPDFGFPGCIAKGIFHSVSAFCNAGFDIMGQKAAFSSLTAYVSDITVNVVIFSLIVIGGLGFVVWEEIYSRRKFKTFSTYAKMVITITLILIFGGALLIFYFEYWNPDTLGSLSLKGKVLASFFHSITPRTAGFNTLNMTGLTSATKALTTGLMYIGGSAGSTAGGIKTATFGLLIVAVIAVARGKNEVVIGKKKISNDAVLQAITVAIIGLGMVTLGAFIISSHQPFAFQDAFFECMSAFGTVGLSLGITPFLSGLSKLVLILLMYFGRVGILTIAYAIAVKMQKSSVDIKYPEAKYIIG